MIEDSTSSLINKLSFTSAGSERSDKMFTSFCFLKQNDKIRLKNLGVNVTDRFLDNSLSRKGIVYPQMLL